MQPYYVIMRLPGETQAEYILMLPMVPAERDNMISWMAARCDGADYGHLFEFAFSKDRLFYGPYQIQARINQNPEISQQYFAVEPDGLQVILGNLLVSRSRTRCSTSSRCTSAAENGQLPELQRVIASYSDRIVMKDTLPAALAALFGESVPAAAVAGR